MRRESRSFESDAVHSGRDDLAALGAHVPPIDLSTTYPIQDLDSATACLDALADGAAEAGNSIYARLHNPTVSRFEEGLARLEGSSDAVAFASGMAALTACLLAARQDGDHVVAVRPLYGTSDHLLTSQLLGLDVTWAEPDDIAQALRAETSLVIVETPANPTLALVDLERIAEQAGRVPVLVDSTFATPVLQRPLEHGATLVLHSATKFLGGHGDVLGGIVATGPDWARRLRQVRVATGGVLHPLAGYLLHRGLQTLPIRVERAQSTATELAHRLATHPAVRRVLYPGLAEGAEARLRDRQMRGPGSVLSFEVRGGHAAASRVLSGLGLITPAVSLGSTDTLIQHPAGLTHRVVESEARNEMGISPGLLRLSVGLEAVEDLWGDLGAALERAQESPALPAPLGIAS